MNLEKVKIGEIKPNPNNPRLIKDNKFNQLVKSIKEFPDMMKIRPIVVNQEGIILAGNMRYHACKHLKKKTVEVLRVDLNDDRQREFLVKDNNNFGEWNWDDIANEWDTSELVDWGIDIPSFDVSEPQEKPKDITFKLSISPDYSDIEHEVRAELEEMQGKYNGLTIK
jgi:ParB-like chromosome segregation protein Spo0J